MLDWADEYRMQLEPLTESNARELLEMCIISASSPSFRLNAEYLAAK